MVRKQTRKMNIALDLEIEPWLRFEAARRDTTITGLLNALAYESRDNATEAVREGYRAFLAIQPQDG